MWRKCSRPGCNQLATDYSKARGKCQHHGRWRACALHSFQGCPTCKWERDTRQAEEIELRARQQLQEQSEEDKRIQAYVGEYLHQGYAPEAAEALAGKRLRDEKERAQQELLERGRAAQERRRSAGEIARCPVCKWDAPVSQGVILKHGDSYFDDYGKSQSKSPCSGTGTIVSSPK